MPIEFQCTGFISEHGVSSTSLDGKKHILIEEFSSGLSVKNITKMTKKTFKSIQDQVRNAAQGSEYIIPAITKLTKDKVFCFLSYSKAYGSVKSERGYGEFGVFKK